MQRLLFDANSDCGAVCLFEKYNPNVAKRFKNMVYIYISIKKLRGTV